MTEEKKKFRLPHWLPFVASLLGVAVLMGLYIWFVAGAFGNPMPPQEKFDRFAQYTEDVKGDIKALSEHIFAGYAEDDKSAVLITNKGDDEALWKAVFDDGASLGETFVSETTGHRCALYYYAWYDLECVIIYDPGAAEKHTDGSSYSRTIDSDTAAVMRGREIR